MSNPCIVALDVGTTAVKVCLFTEEMRLAARASIEYALKRPAPGRAEADAQTYTDAVREGVAQALAEAGDCEPRAVCAATQGETLAPADENGTPLRPFIVWLDARAQEQALELGKRIPENVFYETTGLPAIDGALPLSKILYIREKEPDVWERTHKVLLLEDYLLHFMTGRFVTEKSLQSSTGWFDIRRDRLWGDALGAAGIEPEKLPEPLEPGARAGSLTKEAARAFGLPEGIPVMAGAMDQTASAFAFAGARPGVVTETTGTALVLAACTDAPVFSGGHKVTIYRHAKAGKYLYVPICNTAGMALKWFRDEFCRDLAQDAGGYAALDRLADAIPPGCEGLTCLPFLAGCVDPDTCPEARAVFAGAGLSTTRAHFVRSIMEAIAFLEKDCLRMLEDLGCRAETVFALGGGARSPLWLSIKADACGRKFIAPQCAEATALGAAMLALGKEPEDLREQADPVCAVFRPEPSRATAYAQACARYKRLYAAMRPLF